MNFKKASIICLALLMVLVIGLGQVSAIDVDADGADTVTATDDSVSVDNLNQAEIENQELSSEEPQVNLTSSEGEVLGDYTPDANGIYVSPSGSDSGAGTYDSPYQTISKAISSANAKQTIYLAGGTYLISSSLTIDKTLDFVGYDGTAPVIDAQNSCRILDLKTNDYNIEFSFTNVTFAHGSAANGGVMVAGAKTSSDRNPYFYGKAYFTNCTFFENKATGTGTFNGGGVIHIFYNAEMAEYNTDGDWINFIGCAFINNTAATGSIFRGSGMGAPTFKYCIATGNSNIMMSTNNGRNYQVKDSFWESNSPTSTQMATGSMDYGSNAKLAIVSDVDQITTREKAVFTAKLVRSNGADYGNNVNFANVPITFTVTSGSLSETYTTMVNKKGVVTFTPSAAGEVTVTAKLGSQTVSKTITVVDLPTYVSADAVDGEGNGSLENPYSFADAIAAVNAGNAEKIELFEGNYNVGAYTINNDIRIIPYKTANVNIKSNGNGFLSFSSGVNAYIYNITLADSTSSNNAFFKLGSDSKVDIVSSTIKNNRNSNFMCVGIVAEVASGAELNIEYSQIFGNKASMMVQGSYGLIFNNKGTITANNNWWGSNDGHASDLVTNKAIVCDSWLILTQTQDKDLLRTEWAGTVTTKLVKNDGSAIDGYVQNLTGTYTTNTGSLTDESFILSQDNSFTATTTVSGTTEVANVKSTVDGQTLTSTFSYEVPLTEIFISVDGSDAEGNGSLQAPFKTIPKALDIAKESGCTVYLVTGDYNAAALCGRTPDYYSPISINDRNLTITSYGGPVVIDRTHLYGLFAFGSNTIVEITNITLNGGNDPYANRYAISSSGKLTVRDCLFTNGTGGGFAEYITISGSGEGYIYDSNFTETKTTYKEGYKYSNAAVFVTGVDARAYVDNCRFENNGYNGHEYDGPDAGIAVYNAHGGEAAFRVMQGQISATNCYFANNTGVSMVYSDGLINYTDCVIRDSVSLPALEISSYGQGYNVDNCTFINNTAGAIGVGFSQFLKNNDVIIKNSKFYNNTASKGGAIRLDKAGALIENCYFEGNTAIDGGAIYNSYASLLITHCEFVNSSATGKGGSIYTEGDQDFIEIDSNVFTDSQAEVGGVIYSNGITTLFNNEMHNGTAVNGSYIYNANRIGNTYIKVLNNETVEAYVGVPITINATITDDMANPISGGEIIFIIEGAQYNVESVQGAASYVYTFNAADSYYVDGNYTGNRRYITVAGGATINVVKSNGAIELSGIENTTYKVGTDLTIEVACNSTSPVNLSINGEPCTIVDGKVALGVLGAGHYIVSASVEENEEYMGYSTSIEFTIERNNAYLDANDVVIVPGEAANITVSLKDDAGKGIAGKDVTVTFNGADITLPTDENGTVVFDLPTTSLTGGQYDVFIASSEDFMYDAAEYTAKVNVKFNGVIKVTMIDSLNITATLTDQSGHPIADAEVYYTINDGEKTNLTTNDNGEFTFTAESNCVVNMVFEGDGNFAPCNASITLKNLLPMPKVTKIDVPSTMTKTAVDYNAGEKGSMFYFYLLDENGKGVANKAVKIGIFDKIYTVKTDKDGRGGLQINIANANYYTYAISFLGDDDYKASFAVCSLQIVKKSVTITPAKTSYSFKTSAKTKTVTATLKSTNSYIPKGKQVTLTVAGKTFKATVGDKGQISFNIGSVTAKGTYKVAIKFAGTNTYAAATSKTITIKIA